MRIYELSELREMNGSTCVWRTRGREIVGLIVVEYGEVYVLHDDHWLDGDTPSRMFGYEYGWNMGDENLHESVLELTNLKGV